MDVNSRPREGDDWKSQKVEEFRKTLRALLNIGPHAGYDVFRQDAELCVTSSSALLSLLSVYASEVADAGKKGIRK
jgi:hypothetical protein